MNLFDKRDEYLAQAMAKLDELGNSLLELQEKGREATGQTKETIENKIEEAQQLKDELSDNVEKLKIAVEDSWHDMRETMEQSFSRISQIAMDSFDKITKC
jgi:archaellum component FlaC